MVPVFDPLTFHWYEGAVPPLIGLAVNITEVPTQTGFADAEIVMLTGKSGSITTDTDPEEKPPGGGEKKTARKNSSVA